jgi:hypothetical protein
VTVWAKSENLENARGGGRKFVCLLNDHHYSTLICSYTAVYKEEESTSLIQILFDHQIKPSPFLPCRPPDPLPALLR